MEGQTALKSFQRPVRKPVSQSHHTQSSQSKQKQRLDQDISARCSDVSPSCSSFKLLLLPNFNCQGHRASDLHRIPSGLTDQDPEGIMIQAASILFWAGWQAYCHGQPSWVEPRPPIIFVHFPSPAWVGSTPAGLRGWECPLVPSSSTKTTLNTGNVDTLRWSV